jgi:hypothetical protein
MSMRALLHISSKAVQSQPIWLCLITLLVLQSSNAQVPAGDQEFLDVGNGPKMKVTNYNSVLKSRAPLTLKDQVHLVGTYTGLSGFWDYQTHGAACQYIRVDPDSPNRVHVTYMLSDDSTDWNPRRGTGYALSSDGGQNWDNFGQVRIPNLRSGYPSLDILRGPLTGYTIIANHNVGEGDNLTSYVYFLDSTGFATSVMPLPPIPAGASAPPIWPMVSSTAAGNVIVEANAWGTNPVQLASFFTRSTDYGSTWSSWTAFPRTAHSFDTWHGMATNNTGRACLMSNSVADTAWLLESIDNGFTWPATPMAVHPPMRIVGRDTFSSYYGFDVSYLGNNPVLALSEVATGSGGLDINGENQIVYWSQQTGFRIVANKQNTPGCTNALSQPQFHHSVLGFPAIGISGDRVVIVYQAFQPEVSEHGYNYSDVFLTLSNDNGATWCCPINVTNTPYLDERYPSISRWNPSGYAFLVWQEDTEPGNYSYLGTGTDNAPITRTKQVFLKIPLDTLSGPFLSLVSPGASDTIFGNSTYNIQWRGCGIPRLRIEISSDCGLTWTVVADSVDAFAHSYPWNVPGIHSQQCKVRISSLGTPLISDETEGTFTIVPLLWGTKTVGSGGDYPTLHAAIDMVNVGIRTDTLTLVLIDSLYTEPPVLFYSPDTNGSPPPLRIVSSDHSRKPWLKLGDSLGAEYAMHIAGFKNLLFSNIKITGGRLGTIKAEGYCANLLLKSCSLEAFTGVGLLSAELWVDSCTFTSGGVLNLYGGDVNVQLSGCSFYQAEIQVTEIDAQNVLIERNLLQESALILNLFRNYMNDDRSAKTGSTFGQGLLPRKSAGNIEEATEPSTLNIARLSGSQIAKIAPSSGLPTVIVKDNVFRGLNSSAVFVRLRQPAELVVERNEIDSTVSGIDLICEGQDSLGSYLVRDNLLQNVRTGISVEARGGKGRIVGNSILATLPLPSPIYTRWGMYLYAEPGTEHVAHIDSNRASGSDFGAILAGSDSRLEIRHNLFSGNKIGVGTPYGFSPYSCVLVGNTFAGNDSIGVSFSGNIGNELVMQYNSLTENGEGIRISAPRIEDRRRATVSFNNIQGNMRADLVFLTPGTEDTLNARFNWWGSATTQQMNAGPYPKNIDGIIDRMDADSLGFVDYFNWLHDSVQSDRGSIAGRVFDDENGNCVMDSSEAALSDRVILLLPDSLYGTSDSRGDYRFDLLQPGTYSLRVLPVAYWTPTCPPGGTYSVTLSQYQSVMGKDFGSHAIPIIQDLSASLYSGGLRPGFVAQYGIFYQNLGTIPVSGTVEFVHPANTTFLPDSSFPSHTAYNSTTRMATWDLGQVDPGTAGLILTSVQVSPPPIVNIGDCLTACVSIGPIVRGSFDPNDKEVSPQGLGSAGDIFPGTELTYGIRFQNTGTATAFTVIIRDTLDPALDIGTVQPGASSHSNMFEILGQRELRWTFVDINLPDSNVNEPASHGFVSFKAHILPEVPFGTVLNNTAGICFDYNLPVLTNTVSNRLMNGISMPVTSGWNIVSNPLAAATDSVTRIFPVCASTISASSRRTGR